MDYNKIFTGLPPRVLQRASPWAPPAASPPARCCLLLAPSNSLDAASGWRAYAAVPQHSGPFPGGGSPQGPYPATTCRVPRDHPPCRCSLSAAHPVGSLLMGKALACAPMLSCPFAESFRCIRVVASAVFTAGTSFFGSARYRAGPLGHVRFRVAPAQ